MCQYWEFLSMAFIHYYCLDMVKVFEPITSSVVSTKSGKFVPYCIVCFRCFI